MQLERADLRDRRKPFDAIDLQIGLWSPKTFTSSSRLDVRAWRGAGRSARR